MQLTCLKAPNSKYKNVDVILLLFLASANYKSCYITFLKSSVLYIQLDVEDNCNFLRYSSSNTVGQGVFAHQMLFNGPIPLNDHDTWCTICNPYANTCYVAVGSIRI